MKQDYEVQFTNAKLWNQPRCPSAGKQTREKMWYMYTMQFHSKKNEIKTFAGKWREFENIILTKISQTQKVKSHVFSSMWKLERKREKKSGGDSMKAKADQ